MSMCCHRLSDLLAARYGDAEAEWIAERSDISNRQGPGSDLLFSTTAPDVMVIVNAPVDWRPALVRPMESFWRRSPRTATSETT